MAWLKIIIPLVFLVTASAASAEFYKYYDEKGNVHFTDDFNKVPADQRQKVEGYEEYRRDGEESAEAAPDLNSQEVKTVRAVGGKGEEGKGNEFGNELMALDQRKAELAEEYETLMQENAQLAELKTAVKNQDDADKYNERVRKLNEDLKEHDRKRKEFFSDVEDYNARVTAENEARLKSKSNSQ
jgi:hypothetical protein